MNLRESYDGNDTVVLLYYTTVDAIDANEGAKVTSKEPIKQYEIDLKRKKAQKLQRD